MGLFSGLFGERLGEKLLRTNRCDVKKIKKFFSSQEYAELLDFIENEKNPIFYHESPSELVTPKGSFDIPLMMECQNEYLIYIPSPKKMDDAVIENLLLIFGYIRKVKAFNSRIIILGNPNLPPVVRYFASNDPVGNFLLMLYVDFTTVQEAKNPTYMVVENFYEAFRAKLSHQAFSLKLLDQFLEKKTQHIPREVFDTKVYKIAVEVLQSYLESVFATSLNAKSMTAGRIKGGRVYLLLGYILAVDFEGKIMWDLRNRKGLNMRDLYKDAEEMSKEPSYIPSEENIPFIEWRIRIDDLRHRNIPLIIKNALLEIIDRRFDDIKVIGPNIPDGWVDLYACPECKKVEPIYRDYKTLRFHSLTEMKNFMLMELSSKARGKSLDRCSTCEMEYQKEHLIFSQFQHYFPDYELDLQLNYERLSTGHIYYMWQIMKNDKSIQRLGTELNEHSFFNNYKRFFSLAYLWNDLMDKSYYSKRVETERIDEGYHIFVLPTELENTFSYQSSFNDLVGGLKRSGVKFSSYTLNQFEEGESPMIENSFLKWSPKYRNTLMEGKFKLLCMVDIPRFAQHFQKYFQAKGLIFTRGERDVYLVDDGKFSIELDLPNLVKNMVVSSQYMDECINLYGGGVMKKLEKINFLYNVIIDYLGPDFKFQMDKKSGLLKIYYRTDSDPVPLNIYDFADRPNLDADNFQKLIDHVVKKRHPHPLICDCARPAYITYRVKNPQQIVETQRTFGEGTILTVKKDDLYLTFQIGCSRHRNFITLEQMKQFGITERHILKRVELDLDYDGFEIYLNLLNFNDKEYINVMGVDAATIGCNPHLTRKVVSLCYASLLDREVSAYSESTDTLVIGEGDIPIDDLRKVANAVVRKSGTYFKTTYPINLNKKYYLPPVGRANIIFKGYGMTS